MCELLCTRVRIIMHFRVQMWPQDLPAISFGRRYMGNFVRFSGEREFRIVLDFHQLHHIDGGSGFDRYFDALKWVIFD